jgi:hypothetical protein
MLPKFKELDDRTIFYSVVVICVILSAINSYYTWLNPLDLEIEKNPKQHNGAQPFTPPQQFESSLTLPNGNSVTPPLATPTESVKNLTEEEINQRVFEELRQKPSLTDEQFEELTK